MWAFLAFCCWEMIYRWVFKLPPGHCSCWAKILTKKRCCFKEVIHDNESNIMEVPPWKPIKAFHEWAEQIKVLLGDQNGKIWWLNSGSFPMFKWHSIWISASAVKVSFKRGVWLFIGWELHLVQHSKCSALMNTHRDAYVNINSNIKNINIYFAAALKIHCTDLPVPEE